MFQAPGACKHPSKGSKIPSLSPSLGCCPLGSQAGLPVAPRSSWSCLFLQWCTCPPSTAALAQGWGHRPHCKLNTCISGNNTHLFPSLSYLPAVQDTGKKGSSSSQLLPRELLQSRAASIITLAPQLLQPLTSKAWETTKKKFPFQPPKHPSLSAA